MKKRARKHVPLAIITALLILAFFVLLSIYVSNFPMTGSTVNSVNNIEGKKLVTRIIDGDTIVVEGGVSVRLLGIDADERGSPCYKEAREFLEKLILNKEVYIELDREDKDQYGRYLRYIFHDNKNINLKLVEEGLAIARFYPENIKYREQITAAEKNAIQNRLGCKWSGLEQEENL